MLWKPILPVLVITAMSLTGCTPGMIDADTIEEPVQSVTARHDAYVRADESLEPIERQTYLRTSELLRRLVDEATEDETQ